MGHAVAGQQIPPATHNIMKTRALYTYGDAWASVCMDAGMGEWMNVGLAGWMDGSPQKQSCHATRARAQKLVSQVGILILAGVLKLIN